MLSSPEREALERAILQRNALWRAWRSLGVPLHAEWTLTRVAGPNRSLDLVFRMECLVCEKWCETQGDDGVHGPRILAPEELPREERDVLRSMEEWDPEIPESLQEPPCTHLGALDGPRTAEAKALAELELIAGG